MRTKGRQEKGRNVRQGRGSMPVGKAGESHAEGRKGENVMR